MQLHLKQDLLWFGNPNLAGVKGPTYLWNPEGNCGSKIPKSLTPKFIQLESDSKIHCKGFLLPLAAYSLSALDNSETLIYSPENFGHVLPEELVKFYKTCSKKKNWLILRKRKP